MHETLGEAVLGAAEMIMSGLEPPMEQLQRLQSRNRSTIDLCGEAVSPDQDRAAEAVAPAAKPSPDNGFKEGVEVLYWSRSAKEWFRAVIMGKHHEKGKTFYDLSCKKGARASSMRLLTDTSQASNCEVLHVKSSAVAVSKKQHVAEHTAPKFGKKQASVPKQALRNSHGSLVATNSLPSNSEQLKRQLRQLEEDLQVVQAEQPSGDNVLKKNAPIERSRKNLPKFEVGQKVIYWSENSGKWLKAQILALNSEGRKNLYDLDCKRRVHARRLRPYSAGRVVRDVAKPDNTVTLAACSPEQSRFTLARFGNNSFLGARWLPLTGEQLADWKFAQRVAKRRMGADLPGNGVKIPRVGSQSFGGSSHRSENDGGLEELQAAEALARAELDAAQKTLSTMRNAPLRTAENLSMCEHAVTVEVAEADDKRRDAAQKTVIALQEAECLRRRNAAKAARDKIELLLQGRDIQANHTGGPVNCLFQWRR